MNHISIALDGPSGAGKSTLARLLAERLGFLYVDTGAIYRAVGLYTYRRGQDPQDESAVAALLPELDLTLCHEDGIQRMILGGEDVSKAIRMPEMSYYASRVSVHPAVRAFLLEMQKSLAARENVVMDGRDIGTVVLPDASLKVYITAAPEKRAERRYKELAAKGVGDSFDQVLADIIARDTLDKNRAVSPLRAADDAVILDTTELDLNQSLEALVKLAQERLGSGGDRV